MRIVVWGDNPIIPTGYAHAARTSANELTNRGHEVFCVALNGGPQPDQMVGTWNGINIVKNVSQNIYGDADSFLDIDRNLNPDIHIVLNDSYRYSYLAKLPESVRRKVVFWLPFEGSIPDVPGCDLFRQLGAVRFLTPSAKALHDALLVGCDVGVIPHAMDDVFVPSEDKQADKREQGVDGKFVVCRVDRHQPRKLWNRTLEIFAKFAKDKDDVVLLAKCNPRDCAMPDVDLEKVADGLGIGQKVRFSDIHYSPEELRDSHYSPADVFLTTTGGEGFGYGIVEAMACGLPVVCGRVPALPDVCPDAWFCSSTESSWCDGLNVNYPVCDIDEAVAHLEDAYASWQGDGQLLRDAGERNRNHVMSNYSIKAVYDAWEKTLKAVHDRNQNRKPIRVVWNTFVGAAVGFSSIAEGLIPELDRLGFDVYVNDWNSGKNVTNPVIKALVHKTRMAVERGDDLGDAINIVCWLMESFEAVNAQYKVGMAFCESTRVRPQYQDACNSCDRILTFSEFCKKVQTESGFQRPIDVIPPGIGPIFAPTQAKKAGPFTFLDVGVAQGRKNTDLLVRAFIDEFGQDSNVKLVIKSNGFGDLDWVPKQANIECLFTGSHHNASKQDLSELEMANLYCSADCLVHPSHGEGVGMPILEAAACGLPVIFTNWSAPAEFLDMSNSYPLQPSGFSPAYQNTGIAGENGDWADLDIVLLRQAMRHVYTHQDEAREKGLKAADSVRRMTWSESAKRLGELIVKWEQERLAKAKTTEFHPATFQRPALAPLTNNDRVLIDVVTRDRHSYLATLLVSLLGQTFKRWDIIIQVDDHDESMPYDHQIMALLARIQDAGHRWQCIRSMRQGPHIAHDRSLRSAMREGYKAVCRIDDDIWVEPDFLERLWFRLQTEPECVAVGGTFLNPARPVADQQVPQGYEDDPNYSGSVNPPLMWPFVAKYPEKTRPRRVQHIYSSFMYRTEAAVAVGGYCKLYSQVGHREETDFSHRLHLAGWKLLLEPQACGWHFAAPGGGIRSQDMGDRERMAMSDEGIFQRRLASWQA